MPRGGRRAGAGRPKGSRSKVLHRDEKVDEARFHVVEEAELYLQTNGASTFEGDALAFLTAVYKDEALPLHVRFNAALACSPYERPRMSDARALLLEARAKEISQAELKRQQDEGDARLAELTAQFEHFVAERAAEVQALLDGGHIDQHASSIINGWAMKPERLALPPPSAPEDRSSQCDDLIEPRQSPPAREPPPREPPPPVEHTPPVQPSNGAAARPAKTDDSIAWAPRLVEPPTPSTAVILYARPHQNFWCGRAYSADERGEIIVDDPTAIEPLLRSGCKRIAS
jgi:hypothetical protein